MKKVTWKCKGFLGYKNKPPEIIAHFYGMPIIQLQKIQSFTFNRPKKSIEELITILEK